MQGLLGFASLHWVAIMYVLGAWVAVATVAAKRWPVPPSSAPWEMRGLHFLLIDLPALIATQNGRTWMGLKLSIPFLTWTVSPDKTEEPAPVRRADGGFVAPLIFVVMAILGLVGMAIAMAGCAHGTTGLRQACANEMDVSAAGFRSADAWYAPKLAAFKASSESRAQFTSDTALYEKVRAGIKAERASSEAQCAIADAVDAGGKGDVSAATTAVGQSIANIGNLLMSLQPLLPSTHDGGTH